MNRLFAYGTLCPNRENAHIMANIDGLWQKAYVRGVIHTLDWGPDQGLPAIVLDSGAPQVAGFLFSSDELDQHWDRLDEFEGFQYERVQVEIQLETGEKLEAWTYQMNQNARKSAH